MCAQPDLAATDIDKGDYLTLFATLLKEHLPSEYYQLFQKKTTEFSLLKDPNFRWCVHVSFYMYSMQFGATSNTEILCLYNFQLVFISI